MLNRHGVIRSGLINLTRLGPVFTTLFTFSSRRVHQDGSCAHVLGSGLFWTPLAIYKTLVLPGIVPFSSRIQYFLFPRSSKSATSMELP